MGVGGRIGKNKRYCTVQRVRERDREREKTEEEMALIFRRPDKV